MLSLTVPWITYYVVWWSKPNEEFAEEKPVTWVNCVLGSGRRAFTHLKIVLNHNIIVIDVKVRVWWSTMKTLDWCAYFCIENKWLFTQQKSSPCVYVCVRTQKAHWQRVICTGSDESKLNFIVNKQMKLIERSTTWFISTLLCLFIFTLSNWISCRRALTLSVHWILSTQQLWTTELLSSVAKMRKPYSLSHWCSTTEEVGPWGAGHVVYQQDTKGWTLKRPLDR